MRFRIEIPAGPNTVFTEGAARSMIGMTPAINMRDTDDSPVIADLGRGRVVDAELVKDGAAVVVTIDTEENDAVESVLGEWSGWPHLSPMSFGFRTEDGGELHTRREDLGPRIWIMTERSGPVGR